MDTVFPNSPANIYYDRAKGVIWCPEGLGADDRAGIYCIMQLLKKGLRPTIIFTCGEERGATGAAELVRKYNKPLSKLKYIIELDRMGSNDCVFYNCYNKKFEDYVESFGFTTAFGTFTDISIICPIWKVAGVNVSVGYYDEHSHIETLHVNQMFATIKRVEKMLKAANDAPTFKYKKSPYNFSNKYSVAYPVEEEYWFADESRKSTCSFCGYTDYDYNMVPVKEGNKVIFLCPDCVARNNNVDWCPKCEDLYIKRNSEPHMCERRIH